MVLACFFSCVLGYWLGRRVSVADQVEMALLRLSEEREATAKAWLEFEQSGMKEVFEKNLKRRN